MAETKIKLRFFTIPQWEQEAQWLRSMHKKGWKLQRITLPHTQLLGHTAAASSPALLNTNFHRTARLPESKWRLSSFDLQIISVLLSRAFAAAKPFPTKIRRQIILSMPHTPCIVPVLSTVLLPRHFLRPAKRRARSAP